MAATTLKTVREIALYCVRENNTRAKHTASRRRRGCKIFIFVLLFFFVFPTRQFKRIHKKKSVVRRVREQCALRNYTTDFDKITVMRVVWFPT